MIKVGVIGYGYWGPNMVRNFAENPNAEMAAVSDFRRDRLALAERRCPGIRITQDHHDLLNDPTIDAVAIVTPVSSHFELALEALRAGKHVLVEKPMTATSEQGMRLIEEAEKRNLTLMVDQTFVYTGAVRKIREMTDAGKLGQLYYFDSTRVNLGLFQHDVDVIWDLAVHDLSIMDYVLPNRPCAVTATGMNHVSGGTENIAYLTIFFEDRHDCAHQRQLALTGQGPADDDRRQQADDRVRRYGTEREDQSLRQGNYGQRQSRSAVQNDDRLSLRGHVCSATGFYRGLAA